MDMSNVAYTPEYQAACRKWDAMFVPENLQEVEEFALEGYSFVRSVFAGKVEGYNLQSSETVVKDSSGAEVYRWRNQDDSGEFVEWIHHSNGREYLLFRVELYGYGVFDFAAGKEFFYVPKGPESFIWTNATYQPQSNMLAVEGCFWACPYGVHLVDFSEPMRESKWVDLFCLLEGGYDNYDDLDFVRWDGDSLVLNAGRLVKEDGKSALALEEMVVPRERYMALF